MINRRGKGITLKLSWISVVAALVSVGTSQAMAAGPILTFTGDSGTDVGAFSSIAIGTDGLPVISYWDEPNRDIKVMHCGNTSCSADNIITTVYSGPRHGVGPTSLDIGSDGFPVISYYESTPAVPDGDLRVIHCGNIFCSSGNTINTVDATLDTGFHNSLTIGADGFPVISYLLGSAVTDLFIAKCGTVDCSSGNTVTTVDSTGDVGLFTSIAIGTDGLPIVSYQRDDSTDTLKVLHCGNAACTAGNVITTVDSVGPVSTYSSLAIGSDGLPVVSYRGSPNDLKVVHCGNVSCSAGNTINTVDSGDAGFWSSIAIGASGFPIISYYDGATGNLELAECGSIDCSSGNVITPIDSANHPSFNTNAGTSIALGADSLPVISYADLSVDTDLKVAKSLASMPNPSPGVASISAANIDNPGYDEDITLCSGNSPLHVVDARVIDPSATAFPDIFSEIGIPENECFVWNTNADFSPLSTIPKGPYIAQVDTDQTQFETEFSVTLFVLPEFPIGGIAAIGLMIAALGGYLAIRSRKK